MGIYGTYRLNFVEKEHRTRKAARLFEQCNACLFGVSYTTKNEVGRPERTEFSAYFMCDCGGYHRLTRARRAVKQESAAVLFYIAFIQFGIFERKQYFAHNRLLHVVQSRDVVEGDFGNIVPGKAVAGSTFFAVFAPSAVRRAQEIFHFVEGYVAVNFAFAAFAVRLGVTELLSVLFVHNRHKLLFFGGHVLLLFIRRIFIRRIARGDPIRRNQSLNRFLLGLFSLREDCKPLARKIEIYGRHITVYAQRAGRRKKPFCSFAAYGAQRKIGLGYLHQKARRIQKRESSFGLLLSLFHPCYCLRIFCIAGIF